MKLLKIKRGFIVDQGKAEHILIQMKANETIIMDISENASPRNYGIYFSAESDENVKRLALEDKENKERLAREDKIYEKALIWYKALDEEEREMVEQLGYRKFKVFAQG